VSARLRPLLLVGLLALQAITVIAVVVITGRSTEDLLVDEMRQTMRLAVESLDQRTSDHLAPAEGAALLTSQLLEDGVLPPADDAALLAYLDAQVLASPTITGAYVGRPDGSFVLVSRDGATIEGGTRVKTVTIGPEGRTSTTVQRDADGVTRESAADPTDTYDPRERPWYVSAEEADGIVWTDPYIFFESREPGVTTAAPARGDDGELLAVVGVDLSLRDLSTFVGGVQVSPASLAVLVDDAGYMVASGDLSQVIVDDGEGGLRRASVDEVTDPVLIAGVEAARAEGASDQETTVVAPFEVDGRAWQVALAPLEDRQAWLAAVAAPEDEFVSEVVDAQRRNALIAVAISLGVTVLALPLVTAISHRFDRIAETAATDALTGLPNRRRFDELLAEHLAKASPRHPVCVASVDVDLFKGINDTWGHGVGDEALIAIGGRLRGAVREQDVVARVGGDEFAVILVDASLDVATEALERARRGVGDTPARTAKGDVPLSVTIGVAVTTGGPDDDPGAVLERADRALYEAKEAGRNRLAGPDGLVEVDGSRS
jgi:diguanylate cyclase (GGDEF)-like protein